MTEECTLCGLPVDERAVSDDAVEGTFCCRGCLEVSRAMDDFDDLDVDPGDDGSPLDAIEDATPDPSDLANTDYLAEEYLEIEGMHCTTCEAFMALQGDAATGIEAVDASYATDTVRVTYDETVLDAEDLPDALSGYGYQAYLRDTTRAGRQDRDEETLQRLLVGGVMAMLIMPWYVFFLYPSYVGIETGILTADLTTAFGLYFPMAFVGFLAAIVVFYTGWPILRGAYVSLRTREPNMDLLLSVAILAAYAYSTVALATGSIHLYYDVSVAIVLVVTAGNYYEAGVKRRATGLLSDLTAMRVDEATRRLADGGTETVPIEALEPGDEVVVEAGERIPIDGRVLEGTAAVDEAVITGESLPATRGPGDRVVGGGLVTEDSLVLTVDADAENTLDRLTDLLWSVQSDRSGAQRFADKLATIFVPVVLALGLLVAAWHLAVGNPAAAAVLTGLTVLVAACPCAMGLATPLAVAAGLRDALDRGIVVTNRSVFERVPNVETVVFDKTGTLTTGEMTVREIVGDETALSAAAAVEQQSNHPVASALVDHAVTRADGGRGRSAVEVVGDESPAPTGQESAPGEAGTLAGEATEFERHPGEGVSATVDGERVIVGTPDLVEREAASLPAELASAVEGARHDGDVPVVIALAGEPVAVAVVGDTEREDWAAVLESLDAERIVVLTGDDSRAARPFREHPAVDDVFAGVPPEGKVATVRRLTASGPTAMVGDGTNDAPALGVADVGIAIAGTARAADAADVVLLDGSLSAVPTVFDLASGTRRRIRENIAWAFGYNGVAIPLAALGVLNPLFAAVAMAASSLLVVTNSKRDVL